MSYKSPTHKAEYRQEYKKTHSGWLTKVYGGMTKRNRDKFGHPLYFSKDEFWDWLMTNYETEFKSMFNIWLSNDCQRGLIPSIDRINDYGEYTFDNIQLLTWHQNNIKGRLGTKNKEQCGTMAKKVWSKPVQQLSLSGDIINTFSSVREAARVLNIDNSSISKVCRGVKITSKGYKWRYSDEQKVC